MKRDDAVPLAGWHGGFFIRDTKDYFRLYPKGRLQFDFYSFFGKNVGDMPAADGGSALKPRFFARRARVEIAGEFLKRWSFLMGVEFGGQGISNANGKAQLSAAPAGKDPTAASARYQPVDGVSAVAAPADIFINYRVFPALNFMFGQYQAPFSIENRTGDPSTPFIERNLAIRGFVFPTAKEMGLTVWGELGQRKLMSYEIGIFAGDGENRPGVDALPEFIGRIFVKPFAGKKGILEGAQVGISARTGERDQNYVGYDYPSIRTGQGFVLWNPAYKDSLARNIHIIPSGSQNAVGGELRVPISRLDVRGEVYYVSNHTREAVEGYQLANTCLDSTTVCTERLGRVKGVGWYAQVSAWPLGDPFVTGDPGLTRPTKIDLTKPDVVKKGLEVLAVVAGVNASYDGAVRDGLYDANTPGLGRAPGTAITAYQIGLGANYWHTKHVRLSLNYNAYLTPGSGSPDNLAGVPGNLGVNADPNSHALHELTTRLGLVF